MFVSFVFIRAHQSNGFGDGQSDSLYSLRDWYADWPDDEGRDDDEDGEEKATVAVEMALRRAIVRHEARDGRVSAIGVGNCMVENWEENKLEGDASVLVLC